MHRLFLFLIVLALYLVACWVFLYIVDTRYVQPMVAEWVARYEYAKMRARCENIGGMDC